MLSVLRSASPVPQQHPLNDHPRVKFSSILGFASLNKDLAAVQTNQPQHPTRSANEPFSLSLTRKSVDLQTTHSTLKKNRRERSGVAELSVLDKHPQSELTPTSSHPTPTSHSPLPMTARRVPIRVDGQDGAWTVSVAETPHDVSSYSLYIKCESLFFAFCSLHALPTHRPRRRLRPFPFTPAFL